MQRRLMLDSIENIRDLGGYPTPYGGQTRWRAFLRADHIQTWTAETRAALVDYGVKLVIDLRAPHETESSPNSFANSGQVRYLNLPLMENEVHDGQVFQNLANTMQDNHEMYRFMLDECQSSIGKIFTSIAEQHTPTILFHCHGGKDRTGLVAALLLSLAGVSDDSIAADYALTTDYLHEYMTKARAEALATGEDMTRFDLLEIAKPQSMHTTLDYLRVHFTDAQTYLKTCGVSSAHLDQLRTLLIQSA